MDLSYLLNFILGLLLGAAGSVLAATAFMMPGFC